MGFEDNPKLRRRENCNDWFSVFLQIGREKAEFQLVLDALDKVKTKVKNAHFPSENSK